VRSINQHKRLQSESFVTIKSKNEINHEASSGAGTTKFKTEDHETRSFSIAENTVVKERSGIDRLSLLQRMTKNTNILLSKVKAQRFFDQPRKAPRKRPNRTTLQVHPGPDSALALTGFSGIKPSKCTVRELTRSLTKDERKSASEFQS